MAQPTKVFIGSLPPGTKPEELRHLFEDYGIVVECDVMNRCGFVHMKNEAMAKVAISALNDTEFKGQTIVVEKGRPKDRVVAGGPRQAVNDNVGRSQRGGRGTHGTDGIGPGAIVGFPGNMTRMNRQAKEAATMQLAGVIMGLLSENQNENQNIAGGNMGGGGRGFMRGGGGPMGGGRGGGMGRGGMGGNFHGARGDQQNLNGPGPVRNQNYKTSRQTPYQQNMSMSGGSHGGKYNSQTRTGGFGRGNFNNNQARGGDFLQGDHNNADNDIWNNDISGPNHTSNRGGFHNQQGRGGVSFNDNNFSGGFSGNMSTVPNSNFSGQDRRGFTLPSNQPPKYGGGGMQGGNSGVRRFPSGFTDFLRDDDVYGLSEMEFEVEDGKRPRINDNGLNMGVVPGNAVGGGNRGRGVNFSRNRGTGHSSQQSNGPFNFPGNNNMNQQNDNFNQHFNQHAGGSDGRQGDFPNKRGGMGGGGFNRGGGNGGFNRGGGGGGFNRDAGVAGGIRRGGGSAGGRGNFGMPGGNMNRNAPRQNMSNRRY